MPRTHRRAWDWELGVQGEGLFWEGRGGGVVGVRGCWECFGGDRWRQRGRCGVRPLEVGDVGAGGEGDAQFVGVGGILIVLGDAFADLGGGDADDGVGGGVVAGVAAEDFNAEGALLELVAAAFQLLVDDEAQKAGKPFAVGEVGVFEEAIQLSQDVCLLCFAVNGCRNAPVLRHNLSRQGRIIALASRLCRGLGNAVFLIICRFLSG